MSDAAQLSIQQANTFILHGHYHHIHVEYFATSIDGQPRLTYQDSVRTLRETLNKAGVRDGLTGDA